jgi:hypothetical protein
MGDKSLNGLFRTTTLLKMRAIGYRGQSVEMKLCSVYWQYLCKGVRVGW